MSLSENKLQKFRTTIDMIDQKLVRTINRRGQMAVEYSKWEKSNAGYLGCEDTAKLIHATLEKNTGPIPNTALKGVYREIYNGAYFLGRSTRVGYLSLIHI